jgi:hypothetical protein
MAKKDKKKELPTVHPDLAGFEMNIDSFGTIMSTLDRDRLNAFLDKQMPDDKKLKPKKNEG